MKQLFLSDKKKTFLGVLLTLLFFCSCDTSDESREYTKKKDPRASANHVLPGQHPHANSKTPDVSFTWISPQGWKQVENPTDIRLVTYEAPGETGPAECLISRAGGGVLENINIWRDQMGLPPLTEIVIGEEIQKIQIGTFEGTWIDLKGNYTGKRAASTLEDSRLLGVILPTPQQTFFLKMVGPQATVAQQVENFKSFCKSFAPREGQTCCPDNKELENK